MKGFHTYWRYFCTAWCGLGFAFTLAGQSPAGWERRVLLDSNDYIPICITKDGQGGYITGGQSRRVDDKHWFGMIMAIDKNHQVRWVLINRADTVGNINRIKQLSDGQFIALNNFWFGQGSSGWAQAGLTWIKFDADGQIVWHKSERTGVTALPAGVDFIENEAGEIITLGYHQNPLSINKLNSAGEVIWHPFGSTSGFFAASAIQAISPQEFMVIGSSSSSRHNNINRGLVLKILDNGGSPQLLWAKNYLTDVDVNFHKIFPTKDGWLIYGEVNPGGHLLVKINASGEVIWSRSYHPELVAYQPKEAAVDRHGQILMMGFYKNRAVLIKVNEAGELLWSRRVEAEEGTLRVLIADDADNWLGAGTGFKYHLPSDQGFDFYLTALAGHGNLPSCISSVQAVQTRTLSFSVIPPDFQASQSNYSFFQDYPLIADRFSLPDSVICPCVTSQQFDDQVCLGDSVLIGGRFYKPPFQTNLVLTNQYGCDSLLFIDLKNGYGHNLDVTEHICSGDTLWINGAPIVSTGDYEGYYLNESGCDSLVTLKVMVHPRYSRHDTVELCPNTRITLGNMTIDRPGDYPVLHKTIHGCDSMIHVHVLKSEKKETRTTLIDLSYNRGTNITLEPCSIGDRYSWNASPELICPDCPTQDLTITTDVTLDLHIYTNTECPDTCRYRIQAVEVKPADLGLPNVFSPNGDGINDVFLPNFSAVRVISLAIFDRWGRLIHYTAGPEASWDGLAHGQRVPPQVYVYRLNYFDPATNQEKSLLGDVTVIR